MINITDNNSTILTDPIGSSNPNDPDYELTKNPPCDVSIIEKYDASFLDNLITWLSPLVPAEIGAIATAQNELYKFNFTKMDTDQIKVEAFSLATGLPVTLISVFGKSLAYPLVTLSQYIATIVKVKTDQEYKETLIKEEYLDKYGDDWNATNVVINIDSTNNVDDIKKYISYSGILDQGIEHIYVKEASGTTYELISVKEIYAELVERGFRSQTGGTAFYEWEQVYYTLKDANPTFDFSSSSERYIDNTYGKILEPIEAIYFLLKEGEDLAFPTEYTGDWSVKLYAKDSEGTLLSGGTGNDTLYGGALNDNLKGNDGDDLIYGDDTITPTDTISTSNCNDEIYGGTGNDEIYGGQGSDNIYGETGNDTIYGDNTIINENIDGGDYIEGGAGDDLLVGGYGNDIIDGGDDNDKIYGGAGTDSILGGSGNDEIHGGADNDTINGGSDENTLYGDSGNDYITGGDDKDYIVGGADNDVLSGEDGDDIINGGSGDDYLFDGEGSDLLMDTEGNDTFFLTYDSNYHTDRIIDADGIGVINAGGTVLTGGVATNSLNTIFTDNYGFTYSLLGATLTITADGYHAVIDEFTNGSLGITLKDSQGQDIEDYQYDPNITNYINGDYLRDENGDYVYDAQGHRIPLNEYLVGTSVNDRIRGNGGNDFVYGGAGDDNIQLDDNDIVYGGSGNDNINAGDNCLIYGGTGNDNISANYSLINAGSGNNSVHGDYNTITEGCVNDVVMNSGGHNNYINLGEGNNYVTTGYNSTVITGSGDDVIVPDCDCSSVDYSDGNYYINAGEGNNFIGNIAGSTVITGSGNDVIGYDSYEQYLNNVNDGGDSGDLSTIYSGAGNDTIRLSTSNLLYAGDGDDYIIPAAWSLYNTIHGGTGDDTISAGGLIYGEEGNDYITTGDTVYAGTGNDTITGGSIIYGDEGDDSITGGNTIYGGSGNDTITSGKSIEAGEDNDYINTRESNSTIKAGSGDDTIIANFRNGQIEANEGNDYIEVNGRENTISSGSGDDTIKINDDYNIVISDTSGIDTLDLTRYSKDSINFSLAYDDLVINDRITIKNWFLSDSNKIENFVFSDGAMTSAEVDELFIEGGDENDELTGSEIRDMIHGGAGDDTIIGGADNDIISGSLGNDVLKGESGSDTIYGGDGDDAIYSNYERNYFYGGDGNDTYYVDSDNNVITENEDEGTDLISSSVSQTLQNNIENLTLIGTDAINGTGNELDNILTGNSADNVINGNYGADTMIGGDGNDTYYIDNSSDLITENANEGSDSVYSSISHTLSENVDNLTLLGTDDINATGNELDNILTGNEGSNVLVGADGNDSYVVSLNFGNDTINDSSGTDTIIFGEGITLDNISIVDDGNDKVIIYGKNGDSITILDQAASNIIETLQFADGTIYSLTTGSILNSVSGTTGDDNLVSDIEYGVVYGGAGNDTISSTISGDVLYHDRAGNETYIINQGIGTVRIKDLEGNDTINFGESITTENIVFTVDTDRNLVISFRDSSDVITVVNQFNSDNAIESFVFTDGTTYTSDDVMGLLEIDGTSGDDTLTNDTEFSHNIYGFEGNDSILGSSNNDTMYGGDGNDTISGENSIYAFGGNGNDSIRGSEWSSNTMYGDSGEDTIIGGRESDTIYGGEGNDSIISSDGNDLVYGDSGEDYIDVNGWENSIHGGEGNDYVILNGDSSKIYGDSGDDYIEVNGWDNSLYGGEGNDTYYFNGGRYNNIFENADEGNDIVYSSEDYALSENIENLTLINSNNIRGTGNELDNILTGNTGDNRLEGGAGNDSYVFNIGAGSDTITDSSGSDTITFGEGITLDNLAIFNKGNDKVIVYGENGDNITIQDQANSNIIETLQFADGSSYSLTTDSILNSIDGTSGDDLLVSNNIPYEVINSGEGNDTISASSEGTHIYFDEFGDDTYVINQGDGKVCIKDDDGYDTIQFGEGITTENIKFVDSSDSNLTVKFTDSDDVVKIFNYFSYENAIENFIFFDGTNYNQGDIENLLEIEGTNGDDFITNNDAGRIIYGYSGNDTIDAGGGNDTIYAGDGDDTVYGGNEDDIIYGGAGNDTLHGGEFYGNDTLIGGEGNDSLIGWDGETTYIFNIGDGNDTISGNLWDMDTIRFGEGITKDNTIFSVNNDNLIISFTGSTDTIRINSPISDDWQRIDNFIFADGSSYTYDEIVNNLVFYGTDASDNIEGTNYSDSIYGEAGNDTIDGRNGDDTIYAGDGDDFVYAGENNDIVYGGDGNDTLHGGEFYGNDTLYGEAGDDSLIGWDGDKLLDGGVGNDTFQGGEYWDNATLIGGEGDDYFNEFRSNDTYVFNLGDGNDTIIDGGNNDTLQFGEGITTDNIVVDTSENDLIISFTNSTDSILIRYQLNNSEYQIENFVFSDGTNYTYDDMLGLLNTAPTAGLTSATVDEDSSIILDVLANATDEDGDTLTIDSFTQTSNGTITLNENNQLVYTPSENYNGTDSFEYTISDGNGGTVTQTADLTVNSVNDAPTATLTSATVDEDNSIVLDVLLGASDIEGDTLIIDSFTQGTNGAITLNAENKLVYTPNANYNGNDSFEYTISDGNGGYVTETINVTVNPINDAPTTDLTTAFVNEDESIILDVLANASDIDGDTLSISDFTQGTNGTITLNAENQLVYTPNENYNGTDSFEYTISDSNGGTVTQTVNLTVNSVNDAPVVTLTSGNVDEDNAIILDVLASASDEDGDTLTISSFTQTSNGTITLNEDNQLVYTPNENYNGTDSFEYTISDGNGGTVTQTVNLTVNSVNDAPTATLTSATLNENSSIILDVLASASDIENDTLTIDSFTQGANGTIALNEDNQLVYTPNTYYNGEDSFTYTISDGNGGTITKTVNVTVKNILEGTAGDDNLIAGDTAEQIYGLAGNDTLSGNGGNDTLIGGTGNDYLTDNSGDNTYIFNLGDGNDTIVDSGSGTIALGEGITTDDITFTANESDIIITFNSSTDSITLKDQINTSNIASITFADGTTYSTGDIETSLDTDGTQGSATDDAIIASGSDNVIYALDGDDSITIAGWGNDTMYGGTGSDTIYDMFGNNNINGGDDNDSITSGYGSDTIYGGNGNDTIYDMYSNNYVDAGEGDNFITTGYNNDTVISGSGNDTIYDMYGDNYINAGDGNNLITGGYNNDTIYSGSGNDTISDGYGNNYINSGAGDDSITAGYGNDTIVSGAGNDTLNGYNGDDVYQFSLGDGNDLITETYGNDKISLDSSISKNDIAFFMSGNNLVIDYGETAGQDVINIKNQSSNAVEKIQLSDGEYITNTQINQLIQNMTAYANANSIEFTNVSDVKNNQDLMNLVANAWHG